MNSLWLLTKKNITLLLRAKTSALIVLFGPLLLMLVLGVSYNTSEPYGLNVGIHASSFTEEVQAFMGSLQKEGFTVVKYEHSIDECVGDMKRGVTHTCLQVPENFKVEGNTPKEITFYLDPSRLNLVSTIQATLQEKFHLQMQQASQQISGDLLSKLSTAKNTLAERKGLLGTAKEKNAQISSAVASAQNSLTGLDVAVPETNYDARVLVALQQELTDTQKKVTEAQDLLEKTNVSGASKTELTALLAEAGVTLTSASSSLAGNGTASVTSVLTGLQNDLQKTKSKLTAAATAIGTSISELGTTTGSLQEGTTALDGALSALNEVQTTLESQKVTDPAIVAAPLLAKVEEVAPQKTYLNYLFPVLLVVVVMFTSLLLGTTLVMMEKNSPAFLRNYFMPIKKATFIASTYLTTLVVLLVQVAVILGISLFFIKETLPVVPALFGLLFISGSVFTFLGMSLGYLFTSEETGVLASISAGSLLLFVSGVVLPVESISTTLRGIMVFNPFVLTEKLIREVVVFQTPLTAMGTEVTLLVGYTVALFFVILIVESVLHQHFVHRFMKRHHRVHLQNKEEKQRAGTQKF